MVCLFLFCTWGPLKGLKMPWRKPLFWLRPATVSLWPAVLKKLLPYRKDSHSHLISKRRSYFISKWRSSVISKWTVPLIRNSCRSGNHHAELIIHHFERYNIYHSKKKIIFSYPIRVSTMESSCDAPQCMLPKREWRYIHTSRTTPIRGHEPLRSPQLRLRSVGIFITIKIP